jgi:HEAT repeat protein
VEGLLLRGALGEFDAVLALRTLATTGAGGVRVSALNALQQLRDRGATAVVVMALRDEDPFLRFTGARAARMLQLDETKPLLQALLSDEAPNVVAEAAAALAVLGDAEAQSAAHSLLESEIPEVRLAGLAALLPQERERAIEGLARMSLMRLGSAWVHAVELLRDHDPERARLAIRRALEDPSPNVRVQALRLTPRLPLESVTDLTRLRELMHDTNPFVRLEAATALLGPPSLCWS